MWDSGTKALGGDRTSDTGAFVRVYGVLCGILVHWNSVWSLGSLLFQLFIRVIIDFCEPWFLGGMLGSIPSNCQHINLDYIRVLQPPHGTGLLPTHQDRVVPLGHINTNGAFSCCKWMRLAAQRLLGMATPWVYWLSFEDSSVLPFSSHSHLHEVLLLDSKL